MWVSSEKISQEMRDVKGDNECGKYAKKVEL